MHFYQTHGRQTETDTGFLPPEPRGSLLTHTQSYLPSLHNCSAFNERKTIIKIAIIKKIIYIINFQWVYYRGICCTWPRTQSPTYTEAWGTAATSEVSAFCPENKVPPSSESFSPRGCSERSSDILETRAGWEQGWERAGGWGRFLGPSRSRSALRGRQQLLFLNSPFSVMESLVGWVGEMPLRTCML